MNRRANEAGFTLIELLMAIVILGIITIPLGNFMLAYLSNYTTTENRLSDSHDIQIATAYFSQDVANSDTVATSGSYCQEAPGQTLVLLLQWNSWSVTQTDQGPTGTSSPITAAYVQEDNTLHRIYCGETTSDTVVVHNLASVGPPSCLSTTGSPLSCGSDPALVELSLGISAGSTDSAAPEQPVTIDGQRRQSS